MSWMRTRRRIPTTRDAPGYCEHLKNLGTHKFSLGWMVVSSWGLRDISERLLMTPTIQWPLYDKYTNTQIHKYTNTNGLKDPTCAALLKIRGFKAIKYGILVCKIQNTVYMFKSHVRFTRSSYHRSGKRSIIWKCLIEHTVLD